MAASLATQQVQKEDRTIIRDQQWIDSMHESVEAMTRRCYGEATVAYEQARQKSLAERGLSTELSSGDSSSSSGTQIGTAAPSASSQPGFKSQESNEFIQSLSLQYGEMPLRTWMKVLFHWIPAEKLQKGSGNGRLLIQTALLCSHFQQLHGYEILSSLHELATEAQAKLFTIKSSSTSASSPAVTPPASERINFHVSDFTADKSWVKLPGPCLYYICATAFSDSLREKLFASFTHLPIGSIIVIISYPIPAKHNYSQSYRIIYSSEQAAEVSASAAVQQESDKPINDAISTVNKALMSWGSSNVFIYEKVNQRKAENNILRNFIRK